MTVLDMLAPLEVGVCVTDLQKSLAFWRDALGLSFVSDLRTSEQAANASGIAHSAYRVIRLQLPTGERIKLFLPDKEIASDPARPPPLARAGLAFVTLIVRDLERTLRALREKGFASRHPPHELRTGVFIALVDDPDGNVVELVQYSNINEYR